MKIKLLVLLTGTFLAVAYIIGCGGGGSNGTNTSCPAGQVWNGSGCVVSYGAGSYQNCIALGQGTPAYNQCMAQSGCGAGVTPGYPSQYSGYNNGVAGYPQQNCGGPVAGGYPYGQPYGGGYQYGYGWSSPYPPQGVYNYYPYGYPYQQNGFTFGASFGH